MVMFSKINLHPNVVLISFKIHSSHSRDTHVVYVSLIEIFSGVGGEEWYSCVLSQYYGSREIIKKY